MSEEIGPLFGRDAADLGRALVSASVKADTDIVREALGAIWVEHLIDRWLVGRNIHLGDARPIDVLKANELPRVMTAVREEIRGVAGGAGAHLPVGH